MTARVQRPLTPSLRPPLRVEVRETIPIHPHHSDNITAVAAELGTGKCDPRHFAVLKQAERESPEFRLQVRKALDHLVQLDRRNPYGAYLIATLCLENGINYEIENRKSLTKILIDSLLKTNEDDCAYLFAKAVENGLQVPFHANDYRNLVLVALREKHFDVRNPRVQAFLSKQMEVYSNPKMLNIEKDDEFQKRIMLSFEITREILKQKIPISESRSLEDVLSGLRKTEHPDYIKLTFILLNEMWPYVDLYRESAPDPRFINKLFVDARNPELVDLSDSEMSKRIAISASESLDRFSSFLHPDGGRMLKPEAFDLLILKLKDEAAVEEALLITLACEKNKFHLPNAGLRNTIQLAELLDGEHIEEGVRVLKQVLEARAASNIYFKRAKAA